MTKLELLAALAGLADDTEIFLDVGGDQDIDKNVELRVYEDEGPDYPAFVIIGNPLVIRD